MWYPNLRQLEVFRSLMETRSVTETANRLHVTQPAVSKALAGMEENLGVKLFNRAHGRIQPRFEAERFHDEVQRLLNQLSNFNQGIQQLSGQATGPLAIAAIPTLASTLVAAAVSSLSGKSPQIRVKLLSPPARSVIRLVDNHEVDLGFVYGPVDEPSILQTFVCETEIVCAMHRSHPLSQLRQISPKQLDGERLIFLEHSSTPSALLREIFEAHHVTPLAGITTDSFAVGYVLAHTGSGIALVDRLAISDAARRNVAIVPFVPRTALRIFYLQSPRLPLAPLAEDFLNHVK